MTGEESRRSNASTGTDSGGGGSGPLNVLFLHLDLGIGGAEQLVLQLASASQELGHQVTLLTTRCDADHCFQLVKKPDGPLAHNVKVLGRWIPPNFMGLGTAFFSTLRVLYLAACLCWQEPPETPYLVVVDVLPTPLWLLQYFTNSSLLFYCHFPDKLLIRNNPLEHNHKSRKSIYRWVMDALEESCMPLADSILVNSKFTQRIVAQEFPSLDELQVLYPALDTQAIDAKSLADRDPDFDEDGYPFRASTKRVAIVSLNRYERKKKIELVLQAYSLIRVQYPPNTLQVVIAGGYDTSNVENVEYRGELERLAFQELNLNKEEVQFQTSISDDQRAYLLQEARCVVYTPPNEHFGIVPLEVMYAGTPVIACNSGGPLETIVDGETGFLCDPTPQAFANAINILLTAPAKAKDMGVHGHDHVKLNFGTARLQKEWKRMTAQAFRRGQRRVRKRTAKPLGFRLVVYLTEAFLALVLCWLLTVALRHIGLLEGEESILGSMRRRMQSDEL